MSNSLRFGTSASSLTDLSATQYGVYVEQPDLVWSPEPQLNVVQAPGRDGSHLFGARYSGRRFSVPVRIEGSSASDLRSKIDRVMYVLRASQGNGYWMLDNVNDRMAYGRLGAAVSFQTFGSRMARAVLQIICPEAFLYSTTEAVQTVTVAASPKSFSVQAAAVVDGTAPARPVWVVKNTSGGTSSALTLTNSTTGETISTSVGIANGAWLRFDAERRIVEKSVDSGANWTSFMSSRSTYRNIPTLSPQVSNSCVLTGLTGGSIVITYRARFL